MMRGGRPGLVGTMARTAVVAGTASAVSGGVARRQQAKYAEQDANAAPQEQPAAPQPEAAPPAAAPQVDVVSQLKELAALKDQGILTEEEFAAQKAKILAG
jgi:hypothetical protein